MRVVLVFELPEEKWAFNNAYKGSDWRRVVEDLDNFLRSRIKHGEDYVLSHKNSLQQVRDRIYQYTNDRQLNMNEEE